MRTFWILFSKEFTGYFISPIAYVLLFCTAALNGLSFHLWLGVMTYQNAKDFTVYQAMVSSFFFWIAMFALAPLLTMRSFSEEYKQGTIEMLMSSPLREWEMVWAKFMAALAFFTVLWSPIPLNVAFLHFFSQTPNMMSPGMLFLPLAMIILIGSFYLAIGIFTSSLTKNQVVAGALSFVIIFALFCTNLFGFTGVDSQTKEWLSYVASTEHMETYTRGIFDSRPVVFYLSGTVFFLFLTQRILEGRRLRA
jgi:ABC-2 type transport system permease protein